MKTSSLNMYPEASASGSRTGRFGIHLNKILIVRFSSIGDIVLATPLIRAVRTRFPHARIDFVTKQEFIELLQTNPHLNAVYPYDSRSGIRGLLSLAQQLRRFHYDLFIDIHNNLRTQLLRFLTFPQHIVTYSKHVFNRTLLVKFGINRYKKILQVPERYLKPLQPFGVVNDDLGLELFPTDTQYAKVKEIFEQEQLSPSELSIGFGPISTHRLKQWPVEKFSELGQQLVRRYGARILLFGGPKEVTESRNIAAQIPNTPINLCGKLSLLESAAALRRCAIFVGNDTAMMHIATAMQRKVVVLFGPTVEEFGFYPYRTEFLVISKPLPCRPCSHIGKGRCKISTHACMQEISVAEVTEAVERLLQKKQRSAIMVDGM